MKGWLLPGGNGGRTAPRRWARRRAGLRHAGSPVCAGLTRPIANCRPRPRPPPDPCPQRQICGRGPDLRRPGHPRRPASVPLGRPRGARLPSPRRGAPHGPAAVGAALAATATDGAAPAADSGLSPVDLAAAGAPLPLHPELQRLWPRGDPAPRRHAGRLAHAETAAALPSVHALRLRSGSGLTTGVARGCFRLRQRRMRDFPHGPRR